MSVTRGRADYGLQCLYIWTVLRARARRQLLLLLLLVCWPASRGRRRVRRTAVSKRRALPSAGSPVTISAAINRAPSSSY